MRLMHATLDHPDNVIGVSRSVLVNAMILPIPTPCACFALCGCLPRKMGTLLEPVKRDYRTGKYQKLPTGLS